MTTNPEPPCLSIGTAVSAKYRGAFCEAIVKKIVKSVKCKVFLKETQSYLVISDEYITGPLEIGATVEVKHPDTEHAMEATIRQISDSSMYTVVFDDNDERTLRRTQLCLKGDKHFVESETLDNLPLCNPEHFGTPVIARVKRSRNSNGTDSSSQEDSDTSSEEKMEEESPKKTYRGKMQELVGKLMFYDNGDQKKSHMLPVLVVLPVASPIELKSKGHVLVRSFKDSKFFSVARKDLSPFSRETVLKNEDKTLKPAMEKALLFFDNRELPQSWNREELLGVDVEEQESEVESDADDEQTEEKDRFVAQLYKFSDDRGTPINKGPSIGCKDLNLYKLFKIVKKLGGYNRVTNQMRWRLVYSKMMLPPCNTASTQIKNAYKKYLHAFEDFYRKLGSSMGTTSRPSRNHKDSGRSLVSFKHRISAKNSLKGEFDKCKMSDDLKSQFVSDADSVLSKQGSPKRLKSVRVKAEDVKELEVEQANDKADKTEVKKEDKKDIKTLEEKKDIKTVESGPKKPSIKKLVEDKKESKPADEQKEVTRIGSKVVNVVLKKKEDGSIEEKIEELKYQQKKRKRTATEPEVDEVTKKDKVEDLKNKIECKHEMEENRNDKEEKKELRKIRMVEIEKIKEETKIDEMFKKEVGDTKKKVREKVEENGDNKDSQDDKYEKKRTKRNKTKADETGEVDIQTHVTIKVQNKEDLPIGARLRVRYGKGKNTSQYVAKILEVNTNPDLRQYLVHYQGWNNRHDEWIKTDRIIKVLDKPSSDKKKKLDLKEPSKLGIQIFKKKTAFDKPQTSPSSVKSDFSTSLGPKGGKSSRSSSATMTGKPRPTRSNSIELIDNGHAVQNRNRRSSALCDSSYGSESEDFDKSYNDYEPEKNCDETIDMEFSNGLCSIHVNDSEKEMEKVYHTDSNFDLSPSKLTKVDDYTEENKIENRIKTLNDEENQERKDIESGPSEQLFMMVDTNKNSEPTLQEMYMPVNFSCVKLESLCDTIEVEKVIEPEKKEHEKKNTSKRCRKPLLQTDRVVNTDCINNADKSNDNMKTVNEIHEKHEESPYDFKDEPEAEAEFKVREKKKQAVVENKEDNGKVVKQELVTVAPNIVRISKYDLDKKLLMKSLLNDDIVVAKSDPEVEKREKRKKMTFTKIDTIEMKKVKMSATKNNLCHVEHTVVSVSPERKHFVTLVEKKLGSSPIVRNLIPSSEKCNEMQSTVLEIVPEEREQEKIEIKEVEKKVEMFVVHNDCLIKQDIVIAKNVEVDREDNEGTVKKDSDETPEDNEVTCVASVKRKVRKRTKNKQEMEVNEAVTAAKRFAKCVPTSRKPKDLNNKEIDESAIKVATVEIDLRCEKQMQSCSASPERLLSTSVSQFYMQESQGFVPCIETIDCRISDSQCLDSYISKSDNSNKSQSSVNKNMFVNTPPTTPEHDSDDASHQNSQHNQINISLQNLEGDVSKTNTSQAASSESLNGYASPSNCSTGSSSGVIAGSEGSDHMPVFAGKRLREFDDPALTKCRKRISRGKPASSKTRQFGESDSEDTNMSLKSRSPRYTSNSYRRSVSNSMSPRPLKFTFNIEEGKDLVGTARISFLVDKITEIRKIYMSLKSEVACIDRWRKKLKRKEKEREIQNSSDAKVECS